MSNTTMYITVQGAVQRTESLVFLTFGGSIMLISPTNLRPVRGKLGSSSSVEKVKPLGWRRSGGGQEEVLGWQDSW